MRESQRLTDQSLVTDETFLPLQLAAQMSVKRGIAAGVTAKSLRREGKNGRLAFYRFSGRDHTTLGDIRRMFLACLIKP